MIKGNNMTKSIKKIMPLCYRCEYRARAWEEKQKTGSPNGPRSECSCLESATVSCYMFRPVCSVILRKSDKTDKRPLSLGVLSARVNAVGVIDSVGVGVSGKAGTYLIPLPDLEKIKDKEVIETLKKHVLKYHRSKQA